MRRWQSARQDIREEGSVLPLLAVAMTALIGSLGISLDVGNVLVAQAELRNAADAAALAGAAALSNPWVNGQPDFAAAKDMATTALKNLKNVSNGDLVVVGTATKVSLVSAGGLDLQGAGAGSALIKAWNNNLLPAVRVELHKSDENKAVLSFFSNVFKLGVESFSPVVMSTVVGGYAPQVADSGQILPIAVPDCFYRNFWDQATQQPKLAKTSSDQVCVQANNGKLDCQVQGSGQAYNIPLGNVSGIYNKQGSLICPLQFGWAAFGGGTNASNIKTLFSDPPINNPSVYVGEAANVDIANGAQTADFKYVIPSGKTTRVGLVAVVSDPNIQKGGQQTVEGFGCVEITESGKGSAQYMVLHLLPRSDSRCPIRGSGASSNPYVRIPPQIVQ